MIRVPPGTDGLDVVLCAYGDGVLVEVEAPSGSPLFLVCHLG